MKPATRTAGTPGANIPGDRLAWLQQVIAGQVPPAGVAELLGMRVVTAEPERVVMELQTERRHANPMGTLHGGILCDLADAAMGMCFFSGLAADESFTTLELKINFLRPVWETTLRAEARVVQRGRTVGMLECDLTDADGRLVARANCTQLVLRGEAARGR
jgi:uncharacterized protein (TIGR00369 family)